MNNMFYTIEKVKVLIKIIGGFFPNHTPGGYILSDEEIDKMLCDEEFVEKLYNAEMLIQRNRNAILYAS